MKTEILRIEWSNYHMLLNFSVLNFAHCYPIYRQERKCTSRVPLQKIITESKVTGFSFHKKSCISNFTMLLPFCEEKPVGIKVLLFFLSGKEVKWRTSQQEPNRDRRLQLKKKQTTFKKCQVKIWCQCAHHWSLINCAKLCLLNHIFFAMTSDHWMNVCSICQSFSDQHHSLNWVPKSTCVALPQMPITKQLWKTNKECPHTVMHALGTRQVWTHRELWLELATF